MTIQEFRTGHAKLESLHAEAREANLASAIRRQRFAAWLRGIADLLSD